MAGLVPGQDAGIHHRPRHSGARRRCEPGISRFRVWCFAPSRN